MTKFVWLVAGAALFGSTALAQDAAAPAAARCSAQTFETYVMVDAAGKQAKRIRLCANPGASDADWVATLKSAITQVDRQPFPDAAKAQLVAEIKAEIAKVEGKGAPSAVAATGAAPMSAPAGGLVLDPSAVRGFDAPADRFETSTLPSLDRPARSASSAVPAGGAIAGGAASASAAAALPPLAPMRARVTCLEPGERGDGMTCDFLRGNTILVLKAQAGMEKGARVRFLRRGEARGEVLLSALAPGQAARVRLPIEVCRGVKATKIELQLLPTDSRGRVAGSLGPFGLRC